MNPQTLNLLAFLQERIRHFNSEDSILKGQAQKSIEAISIVLAIYGAFKPDTSSVIQQMLLFVIFMLYCGVLLFASRVLMTRDWRQPIDVTSEIIRGALTLEADNYLQWMIDSHVQAIMFNQAALIKKSRFVRLSMYLLMANIILIIISAAIG